MAVIMKTLQKAPVVTPKGGKAMWCKVNTQFDDYEGKKTYVANIYFDNKKDEDNLKEVLHAFYEQAQKEPEFEGKKWRSEPRYGYHVDEKSGKTFFTFSTNVNYTDRQTGEQKRKYIPLVDVQARKVMSNDTAIGNDSEIRISFAPAVYWSSRENNGLKLYLNKIAVDNLVEFGGGNNFSEFGIELDTPKKDEFGVATTNSNEMDDEEVPF